jgi:hypothetical protein
VLTAILSYLVLPIWQNYNGEKCLILRMNKIILPVMCVLAMSACGSTKTVALKAVTDAQGMGLKDVVVIDQSGSKSSTLVDNAKKGFSTALGKCLTGTTTPARLRIQVNE